MADNSPDPLRFLPVGLNVRRKDCLVVGGGAIGTRKVMTLLRAGASVTVVSPAVTEALAERIGQGEVRWVADAFREEHLDTLFLVVAATDDETRNATIVRLAADRGALVCDASSAERSAVIFGALLQRNATTIAVFTDGHDPAHSRATRDRIARLLDEDRSEPKRG